MVDRGSRRASVVVRLEIPQEVAEYLLANSQQIFDEIRWALARSRNNDAQSQEQRIAELARRNQRKADLLALGRRAYRRIRRSAAGGKGRRGDSKERRSFRQQLLKDIAADFDVSPLHLEVAVRRYRGKLDAFVRRRRQQAVSRLFTAGCTNSEIAQRVAISVATVKRILAENRKHPNGSPHAANPHLRTKDASLRSIEPEPFSWEIARRTWRSVR